MFTVYRIESFEVTFAFLIFDDKMFTVLLISLP